MTADPRKAPSPGTGAGFTPGVDAYAAEGPHRAPGAGASSPSEKRRTLRSPRAALEPERVPEPHRPSRRARHPLVVAGSAIFTLILLAAIAVGFAVSFIVAYGVVKTFIDFIGRYGLKPFGWYRIAVGIVLLSIVLFR